TARRQDRGVRSKGGLGQGRRQILQLHPVDAEIWFVRSEPPHYLGKRKPGKGGLQLDANQTEDSREQSFDQRVDLIGRRETHLNVELGKLRLAVSAQVFIAKTARDLVVLVQTRNHANLLKNLWALGQGKEFAGLHPGRHHVVAGAFGCGLDQVGSFDLGKALLVHVAIDFQKQAMPQAQV